MMAVSVFEYNQDIMTQAVWPTDSALSSASTYRLTIAFRTLFVVGFWPTPGIYRPLRDGLGNGTSSQHQKEVSLIPYF
jgi:hypothetical protein